jgi:hypothetical protein
LFYIYGAKLLRNYRTTFLSVPRIVPVGNEFFNRKLFPSLPHPPFSFTLQLSGNANGDKKLKPLLFYSSENSQVSKNVAKSSPLVL